MKEPMLNERAVRVGGSGIGVSTLLGVLFIALKLTHQVDWSWFYVTMPFWLGLAVAISLAVVALVMMAVVAGGIALLAYFESKR